MQRAGAIVVVGMCAATALAVPQDMAFTYQGRLTENGQPITATVNASFSLYEAPVGGGPLGTQAEPALVVAGGLFAVTLNGANQFGSDAFGGQARWLEITINGQPLSPRQPITAAPYALHALNAPNGHALDAVDGDPADALLVDAAGKVGIGISSPGSRLHVAGGIRARGGAPGALGVNDNGYAFSGNGGDNDSGMFSSADSQIEFYTDALERVRIGRTGRVGIGTTAPEAQLHVVGPNGANGVSVANGGNGIGVILSAGSGGAGALVGEGGHGANILLQGGNGGAGGDYAAGGDGGSIVLRPGINGADGTVFNGASSPGKVIIEQRSPQLRFIDTASGGKTYHMGLDSATGRLNIAESGVADRITIMPNGNVGIANINPAERLHVTGNIRASGSVIASCGTLICSDARFKTNVKPLERALSLIEKLRAVRFDWKTSEFPEQHFTKDRQVGFLAQDVEKVLPELVQQGSDGYLAVDYGRLTPLLVEATKEQQHMIDSDRQARSEQERQIGSLRRSIAEKDRQIAELAARVERLEKLITQQNGERK